MVRRVLIEAVDYDAQLVTVLMPTVNTRIQIPLQGGRKVRSETPKVGETWLIDRSLGSQWALAAPIVPGVPTPTVTGSRALSDPVSLSLLAALVALGLVEDGTTA
jgi:hypothetical protein